jgi:hypothetical protein
VPLSDRLTAGTGTYFLPGMRALVRFPLEQASRDRAAGLRTTTSTSGYPGSPLAGCDLALPRIPGLGTLGSRHFAGRLPPPAVAGRGTRAHHPVPAAHIRGFEQVKRQSAEEARSGAAPLLEQLRRPMLPISVA